MGQRVVLIAFLLVLGVFGGLLARKYFISTPARQIKTVAPSAQPAVLREVLLYFGTSDGVRLEAEAREIEDCLTDEDCLTATLRALLDGPLGDLVPVVPAHTLVRSVQVDDDLVRLDLSREFIAAHPGGSHAELLTVYAIADTLAVNFPYVRQVLFLVEGESVDSFKGHVDLRNPVTVDFQYVRPDEPLPELPPELFSAPPAGTAGNR